MKVEVTFRGAGGGVLGDHRPTPKGGSILANFTHMVESLQVSFGLYIPGNYDIPGSKRIPWNEVKDSDLEDLK